MIGIGGDVIVWCDTDIKNFHPRFVYGLLGPLLRERRLVFSKGFYRRPIQFGEQVQASGGGRVTELTARPLLNLFYPELSGMLQPLSGEYAGRRAALEAVPFFTGYGVETGLLIDLLDRHGQHGDGEDHPRREQQPHRRQHDQRQRLTGVGQYGAYGRAERYDGEQPERGDFVQHRHGEHGDQQHHAVWYECLQLRTNQ